MAMASSDESYEAISSAACEQIVRQERSGYLPPLKYVLYLLMHGPWNKGVVERLRNVTPLTLLTIIVCTIHLYTNMDFA
jgi:hypothetical protein